MPQPYFIIMPLTETPEGVSDLALKAYVNFCPGSTSTERTHSSHFWPLGASITSELEPEAAVAVSIYGSPKGVMVSVMSRN